MNVSEKRVLVPLLRRIYNGEPLTSRQRGAAEWLLHRLQKPASKSKKAARARKEGRAATHRDETGRIREAVLQRAAGVCENCGARTADVAHLDHWLGGSGRRRPMQAVETTWLLCAMCDYSRTHNLPSAAFWNDRRMRHCASYGYPFHAHIEHEPLKKEAP